MVPYISPLYCTGSGRDGDFPTFILAHNKIRHTYRSKKCDLGQRNINSIKNMVIYPLSLGGGGGYPGTNYGHMILYRIVMKNKSSE